MRTPTLDELLAEEKKAVASSRLNATITVGISEDGDLYVGVYVVAGGVGVVGLVMACVGVRIHCAGQSAADGLQGNRVVVAAGGFPLHRADSIIHLAGFTSR